MTDPLLGTLVDGRYEVISRIARGGMATVYLAVDRRLDRAVALKVMHPHLVDGAEGNDFIARFRREAQTAARLTHPGLVSVYDQGVDGETSYLTMEYVPGTNLRQRLALDGPFTLGRTFQILEDVLEALSVAHLTGLVHRDIKPENVLLATDGRTKVADFGLARAVTEVTATTTGTIFGTVAYLGPELVSQGLCDARTDVYAVGILCYEMLTGRQPFTGETPIQVAFQHVNNDIPAPSLLISWLPIDIDELVAALAAREPAERPRDAGAALELVRRVRSRLDPELLAQSADLAPEIPPTAPNAPEPLPLVASGRGGAAGLGHGPADDDDVDDEDSRGTAVIYRDGRGTTVALPIGVGRAELLAAEQAKVDRLRAGLITGLVLALLAGGTWWYIAAGPGAYTAVPAGLSQQTEASAIAVLDATGLRHVVENVNSRDVAAGLVLKSSPNEGSRIVKKGVVTLTVSLGPKMAQVPTVIGFSLDKATGLIKDAGLPLGVTKHTFDDITPKNQVLAVSNDAGTSVPDYTEIVLTVSDGPAPVAVPQEVGATQDVAVSDLKAAGLKSSVTQAFDPVVPAGSVVSQDPVQSTQVHRGDTVALVVSKGPEMVQVPDVNHQSVKAATKALQSAGFVVDVRYPYGGHPLNTVYSQTPPGGSMAPKGSTVSISAV
jgi:eukaryotic-like serine/threonine-protein kinase